MGEQANVLFVDDEVIQSNYYIEELEYRGFYVKYCDNIDDALIYVKNTETQISVIVLDIMMPPGESYAYIDKDEGLSTGILLNSEIRMLCPNIPSILLTNLNEPPFINAENLHSNTTLVKKLDCRPTELASLVQQIILDSENNHTQSQTDIYCSDTCVYDPTIINTLNNALEDLNQAVNRLKYTITRGF